MKKIVNALIFVAAFAVQSFASAQDEPISGILERGPQYSALFTVSPESGDLIGQAFKNNSQVGRNIFSRCLPSFICSIAYGRVTWIDPQVEEVLNFGDTRPSGYQFIVSAHDVNMEAAAHFDERKFNTRYGQLHVSEDNQLFFRDKLVTEPAPAPVALEAKDKNMFERIWLRILQFIRQFMFQESAPQVAIEGNNRLSIVASFENKAEDIVLLKNRGGSGCPAMFRFVTVTEKGMHITPEFGTCSDIFIALPNPNDDQAITFTTTKFEGPFEPTEQQEESHLTKVVYQYAKNSLTKD